MSTYMRRGSGGATLFPDAMVSALQALGWVALTAHLTAPAGVKSMSVGGNFYPVGLDGTIYADPAHVTQLLAQGATTAPSTGVVYMRQGNGGVVAFPASAQAAQVAAGWTALTTQLLAPSGTSSMSVGADTYAVGPDGTVWVDPKDANALIASGAKRVAAGPSLNALLLSTTSFPYGVAAGTILASISGQTTGSTIAISSADTSGYFAVDTATPPNVRAGLNYGGLVGGATPTVQLTETLAGAANSPNTTNISASIASAATVVSASNRTRITAAQTSVSPATKYYMARETHTTSVAVTGVQLTHANIITSANGEASGAYPLILRAPVILTNIQGSLGGSGPLANQAGATLTKCTYAGVLNGQYIYTAPAGGTAWVPMTYAQFTAAGGSVTTDSYGYIITIPPGYIIQSDPGVSLSAGQHYQIQMCQIIPYNTAGLANAPNNQALRSYGGTNVTGDYTKAFTGNAVYPDTSSYATLSAQMLDDPNWTTGGSYSVISGGNAYSSSPILITGANAAGLRSVIVEGCSIQFGTFEFGDNYGNCGAWARALYAQGYSFANTAVYGMTLQIIRSNQQYCLRLGIYNILQPWLISTDHPRNDMNSWPAAGAFTAAAPDNTSTTANSMAALRWWNNKLRSVCPSSKINNCTLTTCITSSTTCNAATISGATYSGTTITYTVNSTANLANGEVVQISGMAPSVYNVLGPITLINSTTFSMVAASAPTANPTTATGTVDDGYQSYAGQSAQAASATSYNGPSGVGYLHNDYVQCRGTYAGYTLNPAVGDPDSSWPQDEDYGIYSSSDPTHWPPGSAFRSATQEGTHVGYGLAAIGAVALQSRLAGYIGH